MTQSPKLCYNPGLSISERNVSHIQTLNFKLSHKIGGKLFLVAHVTIQSNYEKSSVCNIKPEVV